MTIRYFITAAIIALLPLSAYAGDPSEKKQAQGEVVTTNETVDWKRWQPDVFATAKKENRLVLVDFAAEWCDFCKKMDLTTWQDPEVLSAIQDGYIPVRVDDEIDQELAEKYRSYGRPAIIVLKGDGTEVYKKTGYQKPQQMLWTLLGVSQDHKP